jgi:hypothetical protein
MRQVAAQRLQMTLTEWVSMTSVDVLLFSSSSSLLHAHYDQYSGFKGCSSNSDGYPIVDGEP